ncbi:MAG: winged helix-turn-helix domain-containing protein [Promethearchaeota archaeon]
MSNEVESYDDLKYLLGYMGIEILLAIDKGAKSYETIKLFSGLPIACIKGRIPVLSDLKLIKKVKEEYYLTEKGIKFKKEIENSF